MLASSHLSPSPSHRHPFLTHLLPTMSTSSSFALSPTPSLTSGLHYPSLRMLPHLSSVLSPPPSSVLHIPLFVLGYSWDVCLLPFLISFAHLSVLVHTRTLLPHCHLIPTITLHTVRGPHTSVLQPTILGFYSILFYLRKRQLRRLNVHVFAYCMP